MVAAARVSRWTPRDPVEALILCDTLLAEITPRFASAVDRLADLQPGLSGRPAGSGEPGGGSGFSVTSVVERTAETSPAERRRLERLQAFPGLLVVSVSKVMERMGARPPELGRSPSHGQQLSWVAWSCRLCIDLHRATKMSAPRQRVARLFEQVCNLHDLVIAATAAPSEPKQPRAAELANDPTEMWCRSCLRVGQREPRSDRYDGLCRWCGDFEGAQGFSPTLNLLDFHHDGKRITEAMIAAERPRKKRKRRR